MPRRLGIDFSKNSKWRNVNWVSCNKRRFKNAGGKYIDAEVVVDNNLITSRMPSDLPAFMREIINFLNK